MGLVVLLALAAVPLTGGDLRRLGGLRWRWTWLLPPALGLQVLMTRLPPTAPHVVPIVLHAASYVLAAVFVAYNLAVPGLLPLAVGGSLNAATIALNGGTLPASAAALRRAGLAADPAGFTNSGVLTHPRLPLLGDVLAVPAGFPFANVFSVGDVVVVVAACWAVHRVCRRPRPGAQRPTGRTDPHLVA